MYRLLPALPVPVGNIILGGSTDARLQSMTNTPTADEHATYQQVISLIQAGAQLVRLSVQHKQDLSSFSRIRQKLRSNKIFHSLIADVHFSAALSVEAAREADKVRINPGNFLPRKKKNYSFKELAQTLRPLTETCRQYRTAIRIGTNKGSLSERTKLLYGTGTEALVQSTMEFVQACLMNDFHHIILSVKASDAVETIEATLKLVQLQETIGLSFPLHIGVTEAGFGFWGRVKSAVGVGILLAHGVGDTVRISLTEPPEYELEVAAILTKLIQPQQQDIMIIRNFLKQYSSSHLRDIVISLSDKSRHIKPLAPDGFDVCKPNDYLIIQWHKNIRLYEILELLMKRETSQPVALHIYADRSEDFLYALSVHLGFLLYYGQISACFIDGQHSADIEYAYDIVLEVLQSLGLRRIHPEFVSCPSCSRTSYDIIALAKEIQEATKEYVHLKIAVMGCIVNGPGEMGDADYGVVGMGRGQMALYKNGMCIEKNIPQQYITERLVRMIELENKQNRNY